ncbi:MAG: hypothetical protein WCE79_12355 [Xanthobacteraceae bacterium]
MVMAGEIDPVLTLRVALDPPSAGVSTSAGSEFDAAGFKVDSVSPRGLLIAGTRSLMEQFFSTRIDFRERIPQFNREPTFDRLPGGVSYRAYFPREPTYFP